MANMTYADKMAVAQLIVAGLKDHLDKLAHRGMNENFVTNMEKTIKKVIAINAEQEGLKARLKEKTSERNEMLKKLTGQISESKKVVKLALDPLSWKQFGIS